MTNPVYDLIIVGAGPAGLMAAIQSHAPGKRILVLEKKHIPAIKLRLSGKGRCNITNDAPLDEFLTHFGKNGKFLRNAFHQFFNRELLAFLQELGVSSKLERGGRWFPESDRAQEIVSALLQELSRRQISVQTHSNVTAVQKTTADLFQLHLQPHVARGGPDTLLTRHLLLAGGGKSYPKTGSDGSAYKLAEQLGHSIVPPYPALVPLHTAGTLAAQLQGLSLRNVSCSLWLEGRKLADEFGEMLFTDSGLSGPIILSLSRTAVPLLQRGTNLEARIDLKPALDHKQVDLRILREIDAHGKQGVKALLRGLLPQKMISVFLTILQLPTDRALNQLSANERKRLRNLLKEFKLQVTGFGGYDQAIVTAGGVRLKQVNPQTMQSRKVPGLYFAGEILDLAADTGGFNLQAAFSTGWLAGQSLKKEI